MVNPTNAIAKKHENTISIFLFCLGDSTDLNREYSIKNITIHHINCALPPVENSNNMAKDDDNNRHVEINFDCGHIVILIHQHKRYNTANEETMFGIHSQKRFAPPLYTSFSNLEAYMSLLSDCNASVNIDK